MTHHAVPQTGSDFDTTRVIERPDGFYWQSTIDGRESGPFATLVDAVEQMRFQDEGGIEPGESLEEAELGIADWRDPDTGELAEEGIPRVEEH